MNKLEKQPVNIKAVLAFAIKFAVIIALVLGTLYALNAGMTDFIEAERVIEAERRAIEMEWLRLQADYDREYAIARAFSDITCHYDGQFLEIFEKHVNADYIFIGTSHFTHGVTPEEFEKSGKRFFNFALNGSNPSYYVWWYNDVFKANNYVKPKAVIFGVNWFMFDINWLWRRPEFDFEYLNRVSVPPPSDSDFGFEPLSASAVMKYTEKWYDVNALVTYVTNRFPVFSSRERFIELILPEVKEDIKEPEFVFEPEERGQRTEEARYGARERCRLDLFYKGFAPYQADFNGDSAGSVRTRYFAEEKEAFVNLIEQFRAENIPVIFVMAPEYLPGREAPQFDEMTDIIADIAKQKGITFFNYNRELISDINNNHEYYSDWGHLNNEGAHIFSSRLYDDLKVIFEYD